jgi:hypothetical protein
MVYFSCVSTERSSEWLSPISWKPPMRFRAMLAVAAFALAGCNASQEVNPLVKDGPQGSSPAPAFRATIRMTPPNTGRQAAFTPAVGAVVEADASRLGAPNPCKQASITVSACE